MTNTARSVLFLLSLGAASLAGCSSRMPGDDSGDYNKPGDTPPVTGGGGGGGGGGGNPDKRTPCGRMDIVFVVDDSGSMAEEQSNLAQNFPRFIDVLNRFTTGDGKPLDYRVAVTTTGRDLRYKIKVPIVGIELPMSEKGDNGAFRQSCGMQRRWLERGDRDVANTFACAAQVGTGGPSLEMPLYSLNLALKDRVADGTNAGFLRDDALLATVIMTDEDDCSREDNDFTIPSDDCQNADWVQPVKRYIDVLDKVKGARGRWATAVIAGPTACKSAFGDAEAANRLQSFVKETGATGVFSSICTGDLTSALNDALQTFNAACENLPPLG